MRLWIDVREACRSRKTGKGQWTLRCVSALLQRSDVRLTLLTDSDDVPQAWHSAPGLRSVRRLKSAGILWHHEAWQVLALERDSIDAYVSPTSFIVPFLAGRTVPTVPIVHDLIAFRREPHDRKAMFIERHTLPRTLRHAARVCCVSHATAAGLQAMFPFVSSPAVIGEGPTIDEARTWTGGGNHILCIGTLCPRKNQLKLLEAFASLRPSVRGNTRLVLVGGRGWHDEAIIQRARDTQNAEWIGFQDDAVCRELLRTCAVAALVSHEEGFGLFVLDALRVGAPVVGSTIPSIREIAGDAAIYADPSDTASIARALEQALTEPHDERQRRGFARADVWTWEKTAQTLLDACAQCVDNAA